MGDKIQQLLHGYRHGHELLASSVKLARRDADLVRRLSDLSGMLPERFEICPYLSGYRLRDEQFYVLAKTWPDTQAPRAGCVITHSLLLPLSLWEGCSDPTSFLPLFTNNREDFDHYTRALDPPPMPPFQVLLGESSPSLDDYLVRYFGEGIQPIVWFDEPDATHATWIIISALWPALKTRFGFCTLGLQPRTEPDQTFDLYFAPTAVYSRFHQLARDHIVGRKAKSKHKPPPWISEWREIVLRARQFDAYEQELFLLLAAEPTDVSKIFLFRELIQRTQQSPSAILGAFDVIESIAPQPADAPLCKNHVAHLSINRFSQTSDAASTAEVVQLLVLLTSRLQKQAFSCLSKSVIAQASSYICEVFERNAALVLTALERDANFAELAANTILLEALAKGIPRLEDSQTLPVAEFIESTPFSSRWLQMLPELSRLLLRSLRLDPSSHRVFLSKLIRESDQIASHHLAQQLLPVIESPSEFELTRALWASLDDTDIETILEAVKSRTELRADPKFKDCLMRLAERHSSETNRWRRHSRDADDSFVALTYPASADGLRQLLCDYDNKAVLIRVLAEYLVNVGCNQKTASFLLPSLVSNEGMLNDLIAFAFGNVGKPNIDLLKVLAEFSVQAPEKILPALVSKMESESPEYLRDVATILGGSATELILLGQFSLDSRGLIQSASWYHQWLVRTRSDIVRNLVDRTTRYESEHWESTWIWIADNVEPLRNRQDELMRDCIAILISNRPSHWPEDASCNWATALERSERQSNDSLHLQLCSQALRFALAHRELPVSKVVAVSFATVYFAMERGGLDDWPGATSIFNIFGWDKCKELRKSLIESFRQSSWPAKDLAIATRNSKLLRKIVKRMRVHWSRSEEYLREMLTQLSTDQDNKNNELIEELAGLIKNPQQSEEWY